MLAQRAEFLQNYGAQRRREKGNRLYYFGGSLVPHVLCTLGENSHLICNGVPYLLEKPYTNWKCSGSFSNKSLMMVLMSMVVCMMASIA